MAEEGQDPNSGMDDWAAAMAEQSSAESTGDDQASAVDMENFEGNPQADGQGGGGFDSGLNLDVLMDVPVSISMEIGRANINIRNLLQLNQGSIVELDRLAGEPLDVLVNGTLIARGEVVVVNEKFGIRLTDIISPAERLRKLR